jgi:2-phosphosulfolactate phosphatase
MVVSAVVEPGSIATLEGRDLSRACCVVFDVLRATTTMVTGLDAGVAGFEPVLTVDEALSRRREGVVLGGERGGERIEGFDAGNSPLEYEVHRGKHVVITTTNGTRALRAVARAGRVYASGLVNLGATVESVRGAGFGEVILVCAGTGTGMALEDVWAAGRMAEVLGERRSGDAIQAAAAVSRAFQDAFSALEASVNGRVLLAKGRRNEVEWAARVDTIDRVAVMEGGVVRRFGG